MPKHNSVILNNSHKTAKLYVALKNLSIAKPQTDRQMIYDPDKTVISCGICRKMRQAPRQKFFSSVQHQKVFRPMHSASLIPPIRL